MAKNRYEVKLTNHETGHELVTHTFAENDQDAVERVGEELSKNPQLWLGYESEITR